MWQCRVLAVMGSILVYLSCLPLPSLHITDFHETFGRPHGHMHQAGYARELMLKNVVIVDEWCKVKRHSHIMMVAGECIEPTADI